MIGGCALNHSLEKVRAQKCGMSVRGGCARFVTGWVKGLTQCDEVLRKDMSIPDNDEAKVATVTCLHEYIFCITPELASSWFHQCNYI